MTTSSPAPRYGMALYSMFSLFFMWGFLTVVNDVLGPFLQNYFQLNHFQTSLVQFCFFGAYFVGALGYFIISVRFGDPIQRIGYQNGLVLGLVMSAVGSALFFPATFTESYYAYLGAFFMLGLGFSILQIAANPYVAILGRSETASSRLNLAQGFNSLGTTLGPLIGGYLIFTYFQGVAAVKWPYLMFAGILLGLAVIFKLVKLPSVEGEAPTERQLGAWQFRQLRLGVPAIFCYVGAEVAIGFFFIRYVGLPDIMHLEDSDAKNFLSLYWGGLMIGRFFRRYFIE